VVKSGELAHASETDDEPSAEWGWHGGFPRGMLIAGWISALAMFAMLVGNHTGRVENIWLIGVAAVMTVGLIRHSLRKRTA
jgi:hypothetical protein